MTETSNIKIPLYNPPANPNVAKLASQDQEAGINMMNAIKGQKGGEGTVAITPMQLPYKDQGGAAQKTFVSLNENYMKASADAVGDSQAMVKGGSKRRRRWSNKYKKSINCKRPKGFSQRQYCKYGRKRTKRRQTKRRK